ncbi:MAG: AAA family ATPase, partial [Candidatus Caldarchaeum sp.]
LKYPEKFEKLGIKPPRGVLLYGPPGCGKTLLAKAVATESEANFITIKGPEIFSKWVGESEKAIREIFRKARQAAPAVIFFDEIEAIAPRKDLAEDSSGVTNRVASQLLAEIDGIEELNDIVVIGATNRPDMLDPALLRPGRFDRLLLIPPPDEKARAEIFYIYTRKMPLADDVNIEVLASRCEGYSGADIESVCKEAALAALRRDINADKVTKRDFEEALMNVKPSITPQMMKEYEKVGDMLRSSEKPLMMIG